MNKMAFTNILRFKEVLLVYVFAFSVFQYCLPQLFKLRQFNYFSCLIALYLYIIYFSATRYPTKILQITLIAYLQLLLPLFFNEVNNISVYLQWFLYAGILTYIGYIYERRISCELQIKVIKTIFCILFIILSSALYYTLGKASALFLSYNSYISCLRDSALLWNKQPLGQALLIFAAISIFFYRKKIIVFVWSVLLIVLLGYGIRTLIFTLVLCLLFFMRWGRLRVVLMILTSSVCYYCFCDNIILWSMSEYRWVAYSFMYKIINEGLFGIGIGNYKLEVMNHSYEYLQYINWTYSSPKWIIPTSPESDIVYIFCSTGLLLGTLFYLFMIFIIVKSRRIFIKVTPLQKYYIFMLAAIIISGLFEDHLVAFCPWFFLGVVISIISRSDKVCIPRRKLLAT